MNRLSPKRRLLYAAFLLFPFASLTAQVPIVPPADELNKPFGESDEEAFASPPKVFYPETWFHYIGGNVSPKGITDRGGRLFWNTTVPRTVRRRLARHGIADRLPQSVVGRCRPAYRRGVQAAGTALYDARMSRLGDGGRPVDQTGTGDAPSGMEPDGRHVRGQQRNAARPAAERRGVAGLPRCGGHRFPDPDGRHRETAGTGGRPEQPSRRLEKIHKRRSRRSDATFAGGGKRSQLGGNHIPRRNGRSDGRIPVGQQPDPCLVLRTGSRTDRTGDPAVRQRRGYSAHLPTAGQLAGRPSRLAGLHGNGRSPEIPDRYQERTRHDPAIPPAVFGGP